jgi:NAD(P)-dependent dehydrogenase (short-subunit alcohol dehydrogenase family)
MPLIQPKIDPLPSSLTFKGKTCIVTGASAGIGLDTCRQLLELNVSNLYMCVRNLEKGNSVKKSLLENNTVKTRNPNANVQVLKLDMDDYESVKEFCTKVKNEIPVIDILILNAGTGNTVYETSKSGHERILQVNYLSNALLVSVLLPRLVSSADKTGNPTRITWVGSRMYRMARFQKRPVPTNRTVFSWLDDESNFGFNQYADSKLLSYFFMLDVIQRVPKDKIIFNMLCPGMVYSNMADHLNWAIKTLTHIIWSIRGRSTEVAGWIVLNAAAVAGPETNGKFLADKEIVGDLEYESTTSGRELREKVWRETFEEISKHATVPNFLV